MIKNYHSFCCFEKIACKILNF